MITAMQKLKISRLCILIIFPPRSSNALAQIATIRREKQDRNDRRFVPIAFRIRRTTGTNVPVEGLVGNTPNGVRITTMDQMRLRDWRNLVGAVAILNEDLDLSTLPRRTMAALTHVIPTDMVTYNEVDLARQLDLVFSSPKDNRFAPGTTEHAVFIRHMPEHPVIAHNAGIADPVPRKISDFLSDRRFRSLGLYSEFFRTFGFKYQIALVIRHAGKQMIGVAANRALSDFTERERTCLSAIRSHVVQNYRHGLCVERVRAESCRGVRPVCALTQREAEVLHWVAVGKSNDDVARIIGISSATVKKHLEHIYDKLNVTNRTAASASYLKLKAV
jgi:DNA-binding CsgD family transcriptional regulator